MSKDFDFSDLVPVALPFTFKEQEYELREASAGAAKQFANARLRGTKLDKQGNVLSLGDIGNLQPLLVSLCTYRMPQETPVGQKVVETWPERMVKQLFEKAKEISDLNEEAKEAEQLQEALSQPSSPVTMETLREHVSSLEGEFGALRAFLEPSAEEKAKNESSDTMDGSN